MLRFLLREFERRGILVLMAVLAVVKYLMSVVALRLLGKDWLVVLTTPSSELYTKYFIVVHA